MPDKSSSDSKTKSIASGKKVKQISISDVRSMLIMKMSAWIRTNADNTEVDLIPEKDVVIDPGDDGDELNKKAQLAVYWPRFPMNFTLVEMGDKEDYKPAIVSKDRTVKIVDWPVFDQEIASYYNMNVRRVFAKGQLPELSSNHLRDLRLAWRALFSSSTHKIYTPLKDSEIQSCALSDQAVYCVKRLNFSLEDGKHMPTPTWDEMLSRFSGNQDAFTAWVGKLLLPGSYRTQSPWIKGEGGDSKSSMIYALAELLGRSCRPNAVPPDANMGRFWTAQNVYQKRLVVFADFDKYKWLKTGDFRALTGDAYATAEFKGGASIDFKNEAFFLFTSNMFPAVLNKKALIRRLILIEIDTFEGDPIPESILRKQFVDELPGFIYRAVELAKKYPGEIPVDNSVLDECIEETEIEYEDNFEKYLERCEDTGPRDRLTVKDFNRFLVKLYPNRDAGYHNMKNYVVARFKQKVAKCGIDNKASRCYIGLRFSDEGKALMLRQVSRGSY